MNKKRILGFSLIVIAIVTTISNVSITGAFIGTSISNSLSLIAVILFVIGILLMAVKGGREYAEEILERRRYVDSPREMMQIAKKCGYRLEEGYKEGAKVYNGDEILTVIPTNHPRISRGVSHSILEALASGESSFRKHSA